MSGFRKLGHIFSAKGGLRTVDCGPWTVINSPDFFSAWCYRLYCKWSRDSDPFSSPKRALTMRKYEEYFGHPILMDII